MRINGIIVMLLMIVCISMNTYAVSDGGRNYSVDSSNIESGLNLWTGWKEWHFGVTTPISKKGDTVSFMSPMIAGGRIIGYNEGSATATGYGYYGFNFRNHVIGLLNYLKSNITDYHTSYIPIADIPVYEDGVLVEPNEVNMREACDITIGKLTRSWYSREYEEGEFSEFWTKCFVVEHIDELKRLQNRFYWQAYGSDAFSKLTGMMGEYYTKLKDWQKQVLKGVVFSVMEARYRDKNIQGKMNLRLKAAEGELWPFLVNINNLDKIERKTLSGGGYKYVDNTKRNEAGEAETYYDFPDFDTLIDGVYQWMEYYDSMTNSTSEGHRTVTNFINATEDDEDEIEVDWEAEYYSLTDGDLELRGSELTDFYTRCQKVRSLFKKSKENTEGIFGSEELYDISSEVSYSEAMANMKLGMQRFANAAGKDIAEVFNGLTEYNIERTYLMAKNIMANENIHDEYAYYDIGTNIMTYTPGKDGSDYLLIDFQRVKLKEPLRNEKDEWTNEDTDGDGEIDRYELTDGDTTKKVDITGFIKKMVEDELYGNDSAYIRSLATDVDKIAYQTEKKERVKSTLAKVKYNIYKEREDFYEANIDNNKMDWKEWSENYMHLDDATVVALRGLTTEAEKIERLKSDNTKIEVELWKYKSNPTLKDTDFDGLVDTGTTDPAKKSGEITGNINYINNAGSEVIKDTMDYRYFYLNNKMYYDELARMSLIMSNAVTKGTGGTNYDMNHIDSAMRGIGMTAEYSNVSSGSHSVGIAIGHREVEYDDIKKNVILISVSAAKNLTEYQNFSKVGNSNWTNDSNYNANHYEAYDRLSKAAYDKLKNYITSHLLSENVTYWVTGYGTGGGIANLLSARIIDTPPVMNNQLKEKNATRYGRTNTVNRLIDTGNTNVYAYTFGSPNVVYFDAEPEMINAAKYKSIFNVVDTNDVFAHLPSVKSGWGKYGWNMISSGNYDKCKDVVDTYSRVFNDVDNRRDIIETTPYDPVFLHLYATWGANELNNDPSLFDEMQRNQGTRFSTFYNKYYAHYKDLEPKHSIKNYYSLCKKIRPEHMMIGDGWVDIKASGAEVGAIMGTLDSLGQWYVDNVYTYLAGNYGAYRNGRNLAYYDDDNNGTAESYHFPVDDTEYYDKFIARFNEKYAEANGENILDSNGNIIRKSVKTKRKENIESKSNGNFTENYLESDVINGSNIDENWNAFELCKRDNRGAATIINGENVIKGTNERGSYKCELLGTNTAKDDCSSFASEVIWLFIQNNKIGNYQNYTRPSYWGSSPFNETKETLENKSDAYKNTMPVYKLEAYGFKQYTASMVVEINRNDKFELQPGDLLCTSRHVEFYKGEPNSNSFGWGNVHNSYDENIGYAFTANEDGTFTESGNMGRIYSVIYRYVGLN